MNIADKVPSSTGSMLVIGIDGTSEWTIPAEKTTLAAIQKIVGGDIQLAGEAVHNSKTVQCFVNEEGRLMGMDHNLAGTRIAAQLAVAPDILVGPVVILFGTACLA